MKSQTDVFINRELSWIEFNKRVLLTGMEKEYKILDKEFCTPFPVSYTHLTLPTN